MNTKNHGIYFFKSTQSVLEFEKKKKWMKNLYA